MNHDSKEAWGRDFAFVIPVRDPTFWRKPAITTLMKEGLGFLSNDKYSFTFVPLAHDRMPNSTISSLQSARTGSFTHRTGWLCFQGGLDSLAGAVETASTGDHVVLVSHRSVSTVSAHQKKLFRGTGEAISKSIRPRTGVDQQR